MSALALNVAEIYSAIVSDCHAVNPIQIAGFFFAVKGMRKKVRTPTARHNGAGKFNYMALLAPLGATVLRKAYGMWRDSRTRSRRPV